MDRLEGKIVFHIGNVANNAYNSAAYERAQGIKSFAISPDYLHVMAFPFWETDEISVPPERTFEPYMHMTKENMPEWFLYGTWSDIYQRLVALINPSTDSSIFDLAPQSKMSSVKSTIISEFLKYGRRPLKKILPTQFRHWLANTLLVHLRREEVLTYSRVFDLADVVVFYGAHNAYASISNWNGKYISLEHGTLRDYINSNFYLANKSKDAYKKSFRTIITNQDCLKPALEVGIPSMRIVKSPHPSSDFDFSELRELRLKVLERGPKEIFSPTRHSYGSIVDRGKGNKLAIEGVLKALVAFPDLRATFIEWGDDVVKSKMIIQELNLQDKITWIGVLSRKSLKKKMVESLVVLDQFTIPAYGGITADAIGLGVPVITRQDIGLDQVFFGNTAPVLPAQTSNEIFEHISALMNFEKMGNVIFSQSTNWYDSNLSSKRAFEQRFLCYLDKLNAN